MAHINPLFAGHRPNRLMGLDVVVQDTQRRLVWNVGNNPAIRGSYLPRSWWRVTKFPDNVVYRYPGRLVMNSRSLRALRDQIDRQ